MHPLESLENKHIILVWPIKKKYQRVQGQCQGQRVRKG